jgi:hypothetical protein
MSLGYFEEDILERRGKEYALLKNVLYQITGRTSIRIKK